MLENMVRSVGAVAERHDTATTPVIDTVQVNKNLDIFYKKLEDMKFNLDELKPVLECKDNMLITACAGAGKTTSMELRLIHDFLDGSVLKPVDVGGTVVLKPMKIFVGTFLKTGADELRNNFYHWCKTLDITGLNSANITFNTLHAEFKHALDDILSAVGQPATKIVEDTSPIVKWLVQKYNISAVGGYGKATSYEELYELGGLLTYCRNRISNIEDDHPIMQKYSINSIQMKAMLADYRNYLKASNMVDFEMIQEYLYEYMQTNPAIYEFLSNRYDIVYIDEFQDTSELQYAILKAYFKNCTRIAAIGDDDQCIYSWRGSNIDIILNKFALDYKPTELNLSVNYRCRSNILEAVIPSISQNKYRRKKDLKAFNKEDGVMQIHYSYNVDDLIAEVNDDVAKYGTVGIISRTNNDLLIPAIVMELGCAVDFSISKSVSMYSKLPKSITSVTDLLTNRYSDNFEDILTNICGRRNSYEIKQLCNILAMNNNVTLFTIRDEDLRASTPNLYTFLSLIREAKATKSDKETLQVIWWYMKNKTFVSDTNYCYKARKFIDFMINFIKTSSIVKPLDIYALDRLINSELPSRINKRKNTKDTDKQVKLTTVHEAKGKEWGSVIIWNDNRGSFPTRDKSQTPPMEYEEERRLHYIAWTRAKYKLSVYTSLSEMSPFLHECKLNELKVAKEGSVVAQHTIRPTIEDMVNRLIDDVFKGNREDIREDVTIICTLNSKEKAINDITALAKEEIGNDTCTETAIIAIIAEMAREILNSTCEDY